MYLMTKPEQLARAKRQALYCLLMAAALFIATTVIEYRHVAQAYNTWVGLVKMISEAALVGGLADWFAVTALFKPIPPRFPIPHTNIVAANKASIAANLSGFVKDKFFNSQAIARLVSESDPARTMARWLKSANNSQHAARVMGDSVGGALTMLSDGPVLNLVADNLRKFLVTLDLKPLVTGTLQALTRENRHQQVLDQIINQAARLLQRPGAQAFIAARLHRWLKTEHSTLEKFLPSEWISERGAQVATKAIISTIEDINDNPDHVLRKRFDHYVAVMLQKLENDPDMATRLAGFQQSLASNQTLHTYLGKVLDDLRVYIQQDLRADDSQLRQHLTQMLQDSGQRILDDNTLAESVNRYITGAATYVAPQASDFLTAHIRSTIENWDEQEMSEQIELNIGKDLQKVRINGTLVGGLIGGILFGLEQLVSLFSV